MDSGVATGIEIPVSGSGCGSAVLTAASNSAAGLGVPGGHEVDRDSRRFVPEHVAAGLVEAGQQVGHVVVREHGDVHVVRVVPREVKEDRDAADHGECPPLHGRHDSPQRGQRFGEDAPAEWVDDLDSLPPTEEGGPDAPQERSRP